MISAASLLQNELKASNLIVTAGNDLSRGALEDDIVYTIALTAIQTAREE